MSAIHHDLDAFGMCHVTNLLNGEYLTRHIYHVADHKQFGLGRNRVRIEVHNLLIVHWMQRQRYFFKYDALSARHLLKHILHCPIILQSKHRFIAHLPGISPDNHVQGFRRIAGKDEILRRTMHDIGYEFTHCFAVGKLRRPHVISSLVIHIPNMLNMFLQGGFRQDIVIAIL